MNTIEAGRTFATGLITDLLRGLTLLEVGRLINAMGAGSLMPTVAAVEEFMLRG